MTQQSILPLAFKKKKKNKKSDKTKNSSRISTRTTVAVSVLVIFLVVFVSFFLYFGLARVKENADIVPANDVLAFIEASAQNMNELLPLINIIPEFKDLDLLAKIPELPLIPNEKISLVLLKPLAKGDKPSAVLIGQLISTQPTPPSFEDGFVSSFGNFYVASDTDEGVKRIMESQLAGMKRLSNDPDFVWLSHVVDSTTLGMFFFHTDQDVGMLLSRNGDNLTFRTAFFKDVAPATDYTGEKKAFWNNKLISRIPAGADAFFIGTDASPIPKIIAPEYISNQNSTNTNHQYLGALYPSETASTPLFLISPPLDEQTLATLFATAVPERETVILKDGSSGTFLKVNPKDITSTKIDGAITALSSPTEGLNLYYGTIGNTLFASTSLELLSESMQARSPDPRESSYALSIGNIFDRGGDSMFYADITRFTPPFFTDELSQLLSSFGTISMTEKKSGRVTEWYGILRP
ncbi:MAG: hypothetical protein AAB592_04210 [Patescibacteria group bacterium]